MAFSLFGIGVYKGISIGKAYLLDPNILGVEHYLILPDQIDAEVTRLENAISSIEDELRNLKKDLPIDCPEEMSAFLDVHLLILQDNLLCTAPKRLIQERRYNAEWALSEQLDNLLEQFDNIEDEYLRERKRDVQQVVERILKNLLGKHNQQDIPLIHNNAIIVSNDISPADMLQFKQQTFSGFITNLGGNTSHTAIMARSMAIPAIVGTEHASRLIQQDDIVIIDGHRGIVIINPDSTIIDEYTWKKAKQELELKKLERFRHIKTQTLDGKQIELLANIELPSDAMNIKISGADGVGLFRSEFLFFDRQQHSLPTENEQFEAYYKTIIALDGLPLTIRTIDIGSDKKIKDLDTSSSPLGLRAIRWSLAEPDMFKIQLKAILRASHYGNIQILIPMLSNCYEIKTTLKHIQKCKDDLRAENINFDDNIKIGGMIEVPAAAFALPMFAPYLDFISIGTNDLIQYTLAIDRTDRSVAYLYDHYHPAIIHLIAHIIQTADLLNMPVSICGELAGDPTMTRLFVGMGLTRFSMHPNQLLFVKEQVLKADSIELKEQLRDILTSYDADIIKNGILAMN
jgi:phosphoenolpyruvate-protein phosphotransferase (PTS system enzyme I)